MWFRNELSSLAVVSLYCTYKSHPLTRHCSGFPTRSPVCAPWPVSCTHVTVHNSIFVVSGGFNKFATCARAVALNGRKGGLHTFHCAYISRKLWIHSHKRGTWWIWREIFEEKKYNNDFNTEKAFHRNFRHLYFVCRRNIKSHTPIAIVLTSGTR